ncbi:MAG: amidohydrolase [Ruminococcaceae bacterium]|nr:amidohydrolase [Oscillospiraceae bacterium]
MKKISEILGYAPIDIHSHIDHGVLGDRTDYIEEWETNVHFCTREFVKTEYDNVGIEIGAMSTYSSVARNDTVFEENIYLNKLLDDEPRFRQWAVVNPDREETFAQAEELLKDSRVLGIKIHPSNHGYDIMKKGDEIFSFADSLGATVLMHPIEERSMPVFANRYPNMRLIIAHLADEKFVDAMLGAKHGNIYADTSGGASSKNNVVEYAVSRVGAERILFGTDTYSTAFQTGRIAFARISDGDKFRILRGNALALFPKAFE